MLDINSGLPNPVIELSDDDLKSLKAITDELPVDPEPAYESASPEKLGYRGYTIGMLPAKKPGEYIIVRVYRTGVEVRTFIPKEERSLTVVKLDASRSFEAMLTKLVAAKGLIGPRTLEDIASGVDLRERRKK